MLVNPAYLLIISFWPACERPLLHFSEGNKGNKCLRLEAISELPWHSYAVEALYLGSFSNNDGKENVKKAIAGFHCHAIKIKIENHSMNEVKKFTRYRRYINKYSVQASGLCGIPYSSYLT